MRPTAFLAATALGLTLALPATAQERSDAEIKALVLEAIRENPEIVMEAVGILQARDEAAARAEAQAALDAGRPALEDDPNAPVLGNPEGDVTVVEFFDYNCPYCRRAGDELAQLIEGDGKVRVVMREWPILGDGSVFAARAALAARQQDAYAAMHEAMMAAEGRLDETSVMALAAELGLDTDRLRADMDAPEVQAHIDDSMELAQSLGFSGTPSFVIGDMTAPGLVEAEQMQEMVEAAREGG
ncbi:DsbA family protein [Jannaschia ovalis]|uniref:DsbA family protein n=1 Tax=Jannaschia ovalis TaxID=3038773 RepID=A0ABY8LHD3_9RHOB|nr:DsbA family protein [Jannaschia sp. GRR-S6-38]WGH79550.1 DsbA family protein [Jannaschia sp. GRR-S6-38]